MGLGLFRWSSSVLFQAFLDGTQLAALDSEISIAFHWLLDQSNYRNSPRVTPPKRVDKPFPDCQAHRGIVA